MNSLTLYRIVGFLEGISYLILLFIGMPLKYWYQNDLFVKMMGMPHGLLFVLYIILTFFIGDKFKWGSSTYLKALIASILPFGTFIFDSKVLKVMKS